MNNLIKLTNRLKKININVEFFGNYPWIYLDKVNGNKVKETYLSDHGFTVTFLPTKEQHQFDFVSTKEMFKIIRKYK